VRQSPNIRLSNHVLGMPPNVQPSDRPPASEESVSLVERARHCTFTQKSALLVGGRIVETPRPETRGVTRMKRIVLEILFAAIVLVVRTPTPAPKFLKAPLQARRFQSAARLYVRALMEHTRTLMDVALWTR
jgi:hypothetical protein